MNYDQSIMEEFVTESKEHLETVEGDLLSLEKHKDKPDKELINRVFRAIHTVKGSAGFLGLNNINNLSHIMETLLSMMQTGNINPEPKFINALLEGVDSINIMLLNDINLSDKMDVMEVENHLKTVLAEEVPSRVQEALNNKVAVFSNEEDNLDLDIDEFALKNIQKDHEFLYVLKYELTEFRQQKGKNVVELVKQLTSMGKIITGEFKVPCANLNDYMPDNSPMLYNILYSTVLEPDLIESAVELPVSQIIQIEKEKLIEQAENKKTPEKDVPSPTSSEQLRECEGERIDTDKSVESENKQESAKHQANTIRINVETLDELMRLAGELVLVRNQHLLNIDKSNPVSRGITQRLDVVTSEIQETIMLTRMQPIGNVFSKFHRIVRNLGQKLGKQIEIIISGSEVELDKTIIESLSDPLTHLIRNSCDHGIETPAERKHSGKSQIGHIELKAYHEGGHINIEIKDDGKGVNLETLKQKALERGVKNKIELSQMNEKELMNLILLPGFSTTNDVSDISGRGVGMDVVRTNTEKLGGTLELESVLGEGITVYMRLPLTLAIIPSLIVVVGKFRYAIPQVNLEELVCLYDKDIMTKIECAGGQEVYRLRDCLLPLVRLSEVLERHTAFTGNMTAEISEKYRKTQEELLCDREKDTSSGFSRSLIFAVVKLGTSRFGLVVDQVMDTEEIVVKPMHSAVKSLSCYSGAAVMGDGKVAMILDIDGIAKHANITINNHPEKAVDKIDKLKNNSNLQTILFFKSGPKEQFAIPLPDVQRIKQIALSNIDQVNEKEFITIDGVSTLILRLDHCLNVSPCDEIQKPEMFFLLPKHAKHPFGILLSSLVDIEEVSVDLNVESYKEDGLLGTSVIHDHMTLFIDMPRLIRKAEPNWFDSERFKN